MISETKFSQYHTSTWRLLTPAMDLFVRRVNLDLYKREFPVLVSNVDAPRRGFINELAFDIYSMTSERDPHFEGDDALLARATYRAQAKIARIENIPIGNISKPNEIELQDCTQQVQRLRSFFFRLSGKSHVHTQPKFPGAGFLDSCEGDVFVDGTLFEIKAGQRGYKSVDIKQLLTYAALNYAAGQRQIEQLGLFNPRMGTSFTATIDTVAHETSGCRAIELLQELVRVISSGDTSR